MIKNKNCAYFRPVNEDNFTCLEKSDCKNCLHYKHNTCRESSTDDIFDFEFM